MRLISVHFSISGDLTRTFALHSVNNVYIQFSLKMIISSFLPWSWLALVSLGCCAVHSQSLSIVFNFFACSAFGNGKSSVVLSWTMATGICTIPGMIPHELYKTTACIHCSLAFLLPVALHTRTPAQHTLHSLELTYICSLHWAHCSCGIAWSCNRC